MNATTKGDIERFIDSEKQRAMLESNTSLNPPTAFLVNPSANTVDLVWDAPRDGLVTGYEIGSRYASEAE